MSVVAEGSELFPCSAIPLVSSSRSPVDGSPEVVATLDTGVQLFNAAGNRLESSWSVTPGKLLTCAAFRHSSTGRLVCVEDGSVLCSWPQSAKTLAKASRRHFRKGIHSAHSRAGACGADTVVVQKDGKVVLVGDSNEAARPAAVPERLQGALDPAGEVVHAELASSGSGGKSREQQQQQHALCVLRRVGKGRGAKRQLWLVVDVYGFVLGDEEDGEEHSRVTLIGSHRIDVPPVERESGVDGGEVVSCSFQLTSQGNRTLSLLWSSGLWQVLAFPGSAVAAAVRMSLRHAPRVLFERELGCFGKDHEGRVCASTAFVSPAYLAIVGKAAEGGATGAVVTVWETLYGTLQGQVSLPGPSNKQQKKQRRRKARGGAKQQQQQQEEEAQRVSVLAGADKRSVVVVQSHAVHSCPISGTPPSLASSLGIMASTAQLLGSGAGGDAAAEPPLFFTANPMPLLQDMKAKKKRKRGASEGAATAVAPARPLWGSETQTAKASASWEKSFRSVDEEERKVLQQLCPDNEKATPGLKKFQKLFDAYVSKVEAAGDLATAHVAGRLDKQGRKRAKDVYRENRMMTLLSERFVTTVAQRCLRRGLWTPLRTLIDTNALSARVLPDLVSTLVEKKQLQLLERSLVHVHDVPESDLVLVLQSVLTEGAWDETTQESEESQGERRSAAENMQQQLQQDPEQGAKRKKRKTTKKSPPKFTRTARPEALLLHLVLSAPRSDAVLKRSLGELSPSQALKLLGHLNKWMNRYWLATEHEVKVLFRDSGLRAPTFGQVLDWTRMTLDAHFRSFVQDPQPEVQDMAKELQYMVVGQHLALCREMSSMRGLLATFNKQQAGGPKPSKPLEDYSLVTLRV